MRGMAWERLGSLVYPRTVPHSNHQDDKFTAADIANNPAVANPVTP